WGLLHLRYESAPPNKGINILDTAADRRLHPAVDRRARREGSMKRSAILTATLCVSLAMARPAGRQPQARLTLELEDYAALPITADNTNDNTRAQLARVNNLRDEPGGRRFFVNDLNGPLYILDKQTKAFTTYLDFNGAAGRPGLFSRFTFERNFATGLTNFVFDPDYARNGVFYTLHMEDPAVEAPASPQRGVVAGLDLAGYTTTPAPASNATVAAGTRNDSTPSWGRFSASSPI